MKRILLALVLFISLPAMAEDTFCAPNNAYGEIHLLAGEKKLVISTTSSGHIRKGTWQVLGSTRILVRWDDGKESIYLISQFNKCVF